MKVLSGALPIVQNTPIIVQNDKDDTAVTKTMKIGTQEMMIVTAKVTRV